MQDAWCSRCQLSGEILSRITVAASVRAENVGRCRVNTMPNYRFNYDAQHMGPCNVPPVVSHVSVDMYSTQIRHNLDIDSTCFTVAFDIHPAWISFMAKSERCTRIGDSSAIDSQILSTVCLLYVERMSNICRLHVESIVNLYKLPMPYARDVLRM